MISAAMFDLDGTLVETEELKAISHARTVHALSPGVSQEEVAAAYTSDLVGRSRQEVAMSLVERFGLEEAARARMADLGETEPWRVLVRLRHGIYDEILADAKLLLGQRYQHNIDLLLQMRREGYPTACATMSHIPQVRRVLSVLGLENAFDVVATMEDVKRGKPDPEIDLLVAERLGVPPEEFLVIEDSPAGIGAAVAAGMAVVAVPTKITSKKVHAANLLDPRWIVDDSEKLPDVVRQRIEAAGGSRLTKS